MFDNGPFTYFGHKALQTCFNPDSPLTQSTNNLGTISNGTTNPALTPGSDSPGKAPNPVLAWKVKSGGKIPDFIPDFTLSMKDDEDKIVYLRITRNMFSDYLRKDEQANARMELAETVVAAHKAEEARIRAVTGPTAMGPGTQPLIPQPS